MMRKDMIAPCGLNCAICYDALQEESPCPGCLGPAAEKHSYCATCAIVTCEKRKNLPGGYCDACPDFPCADVMEKERRYANAYPMVESPIGNLEFINKNGIDSFLKREETRWTCPDCGGTICVHMGVCSKCGRKFSDVSRAKR